VTSHAGGSWIGQESRSALDRPVPSVISMNTKLQVSTIMLGVQDVARAKKFYAEGLGCEIEQDYPGFVKCSLGEGSSSLALYEWEAAAQDAGVSPEGSGFRGSSFHFITDSRDTVDEVMRTAVAAGGTVVKEAAATDWGGYFGYFSDPDGYLWKVATTA
jgi:catechol 2,3-dioxygenase-like lactoylglutathione lyase family enzyme